MVLEKQYISVEQFAQLMNDPQYRDHRLELVDGELVIMTKPQAPHGFVAGEVYFHLRLYVGDHGGTVFVGETGLVVRENPSRRDTVRGVDVAYYGPEKLQDGVPDGFLRLAPDLIVEVISPGNEADDINDKILEYQALGTPLVWIVYPQSRTVMVHQGRDARRYFAEDRLDGGEVLPGFRVQVADLFPARVVNEDDQR